MTVRPDEAVAALLAMPGVRVELAHVEPGLLEEQVDDAWRRRAPAALREGRTAGPGPS